MRNRVVYAAWSCTLAFAACGAPSPVASDRPAAQAPDASTGVFVDASADGGREASSVDPDGGASCLPVADALAFANTRMQETVAYVKSAHAADFATYYPAFTYSAGADLGKWDLSPRSSQLVNSRVTDWRSGYYAGAFWQLYAATGSAEMLGYAKAWTSGIEALKANPLDYDIGGRFLRSFGDGLHLLAPADDADSSYRNHARDVLVQAATTLDRRFDQGGIPVGALRSLDDYPPGPYPVYIDGMVNVPLLFEAWDISGRPTTGPMKTLFDHGVSHARTVLDGNVRADGSIYHIVQYNDGTSGTPRDGKVYSKITDQGYASESTWSRGQAWGLYGFTEVYRYTKDVPAVSPERFLAVAERAADYFIAHLPNNYAADTYNLRAGDFVPPTDFDAALGEPAGPFADANKDRVFGDRKPALRTFTERDSSAAAVAASGLFELATLASTPANREKYLAAAEAILRSLLTYRGPDGKLVYLAKDSPHRGLLASATVSWNLPQISLMFGDYYFLESLRRYRRARPAC
jgi:unsaturated chondroitin disaccharide hydrolase